MTDVSAPTTLPPRAQIHAPSRRSILLKRLLACLAGGVVLAMMVGPQEGSQTDYGYAFRKSVLEPRIVVFLGIGVLLFLAITYWPTIVPYLTRPGFWPLVSGALAVVAAITLMHWYDPAGDGKFSSTATVVRHASTYIGTSKGILRLAGMDRTAGDRRRRSGIDHLGPAATRGHRRRCCLGRGGDQLSRAPGGRERR